MGTLINLPAEKRIIARGAPVGALLPAPPADISIRAGRMEDIAFIDAMQKVHSKQLGWMPQAQLEGKIRLGHVLVAEGHGGTKARRHEVPERASEPASGSGPFVPSCLRAFVPSALGYLIGNDQYFKRDDVGIIYQLCVAPGTRRSLVGAALVKAMFERAAYGCRLFCCWCAQDIEGNRFWESLGFVPLAFRAGSEKKSRVHIFWQKRIRPGDTTTPYWYPAQTGAGAIREDRLVLPIPHGVHWSDAKPMVLPGAQVDRQVPQIQETEAQAPRRRPAKAKQAVKKAADPAPRGLCGFSFAPPTPAETPPAPAEKKPRQPRQRRRNDPAHIAFARELRDRWMEEVSADESLLLPAGKYDLTGEHSSSARRIDVTVIDAPALPAPKTPSGETPLLPAA